MTVVLRSSTFSTMDMRAIITLSVFQASTFLSASFKYRALLNIINIGSHEVVHVEFTIVMGINRALKALTVFIEFSGFPSLEYS